MNSISTDPVTIIVVMFLLGLAPFVLVMVSSFVKLVVVFNLIRSALGLQQVPPNIVINGLALILSLFVLYPVLHESGAILKGKDFSNLKAAEVLELGEEASQPLKGFLKKHTREEQKMLFVKVARKIWPAELVPNAREDSFAILIPAFILRELSLAFQIGFYLYLPFIIIDLVVSNILLAMGMMMVSPTVIALPFKLLLFVFVKGWTRVIEGLLLGYQ